MRVRPSKSVSIVSFIISVAFVVVGLFVVIPRVGLFGVLWTAMALVMSVYHAANAFTKKGIANFVVDRDASAEPLSTQLPADERLRRLSQMKEDGLINESEFQQKRKEIMSDKW